ncbi:hypothetical protein DL766_000826 [Monosporascus sp. MC13-8B]|uniref:Uncharacterized protein n=1 Tax=Monosporascus cannonballus TaxID=155416 RepID=A0ABY0GU28_9PEZI|nr:hypothetical protein DL762_009423 [Monosporascus cannonballus]RYO82714.1 hypothetical protein DL763_008169 [Monosporascus cannonballus]RYP38616.1 hypothetical protein DL766_000826 [Monosporascus sp. MC13-8B]
MRSHSDEFGTRAVFGVDGPVSNPASISNANMLAYANLPMAPGVGAGRALTAKRSLREGLSHARATSPKPQVYDPPRPPREGYEWVWFPAGYWAEREIVESPPARKADSNAWPSLKWHKRSAKETSSGWTPDEPESSPRTPIDSPSPPARTKLRQPPPLASPYLSEQAHVQSLQQPNLYPRRRTSSTDSESKLALMEQTGAKPKPPPTTLWPGKDSDAQQTQHRSYFHFGTSDESTLSSVATPSGRPTTRPHLSPGASELAHVKSLQGRPPLLGKPSSESFTTTVTRHDDESIPQIRTSSLASSRRQSGPSTLPNPQRRSEETTKSSQPSISVEEAKPKQSFMKWLGFESRRKPRRARTEAGGVTHLAHMLAQEVSHVPQPQIPSNNRLASLHEDANGNSGSKLRSRRLFGKGTWRHKTSAASSTSPSGSVRDVLRGGSPEYTSISEFEPYPESHHWSSLFPGGEARRVKTPPLRNGTVGGPRAFFFDISTPNGGANSAKTQQGSHGSSSGERQQKQRRETPPAPRTPTSQHAPQASGSPDHHPAPRRATRLSQHASGGKLRCTCTATTRATQMRTQKETPNGNGKKEWWEVRVPVPSYEDVAPSAFRFDLPEHLPSSPMCPANKKHKSGGTGVCVYHGRRKRSSEVIGGEADNNRGRVDIGGDPWD